MWQDLTGFSQSSALDNLSGLHKVSFSVRERMVYSDFILLLYMSLKNLKGYGLSAESKGNFSCH
jgi:hypothetical protein